MANAPAGQSKSGELAAGVIPICDSTRGSRGRDYPAGGAYALVFGPHGAAGSWGWPRINEGGDPGQSKPGPVKLFAADVKSRAADVAVASLLRCLKDQT